MRVRMTVMMVALLGLTCAGVSRAAEETPLLTHAPTLSKTQVVFAYGGLLVERAPGRRGRQATDHRRPRGRTGVFS